MSTLNHEEKKNVNTKKWQWIEHDANNIIFIFATKYDNWYLLKFDGEAL